MIYIAIQFENEGGYVPPTTSYIVGFETEDRAQAFKDTFEQYRYDNDRWLGSRELKELMSGAWASMCDQVLCPSKMDVLWMD